MARLWLIAATAAACVAHGADAAMAQAPRNWPAQPITMVVPYAAGGPVDTVGRIVAARLGEILGQQVIVDNVGGAGGMIGAARVARAAPDGYQVLFGSSATLAQNQSLYKVPLYDAATDFSPVALLTDSPRVLIARKDFPAGGLAEFIAYAKANRDGIRYGSAGVGSGSHVCAILLDHAMGVQITHVPYRGAGPAMQDLIGGRLDYMCEQISTAVPQITGRTVKALAVLGPERSDVLPGVPSAREAGLGDFDCGAWDALAFPKGTPEAIVRRLAEAAGEAVNSAMVRDRLAALGVSVVAPERRTPDYLAGYIRGEIAKWALAIKASGLKAE